jgi:spermidine synthase
MFVGATLLFVVQPMVGKMILPLLGGTPAVWSTCMVFFQAALLAGYAYAHASTAWLGASPRQALLHLGILVIPLSVLPLAVNPHFLRGGAANPVLDVLLLLSVSVGLPFFVVSATAPLLQKWFSHTGHPAARDPYFLYAASNLGSMLALLGYPTLIEPRLHLRGESWMTQTRLWSVGYVALAALIALCALVLWRRAAVPAPVPVESSVPPASSALVLPPSMLPASMLNNEPPSMRRRLRWIVLAFVPSSLFIGATTYITTDVAAVPLLWVLPLAIYLLSFILTFGHWPDRLHRLVTRATLPVLLTVLFLMVSGFKQRIWITMLWHFLLLLLVALACHGELARSRPASRYLTEFYLLLSVGGVLGGLFNALIAPVVFGSLAEYPLVMVLAGVLLSARDPGPSRSRRADLVLALAVVGLGLVLYSDSLSVRIDFEFLTGLLKIPSERAVEWLTPIRRAANKILMYGLPLVGVFALRRRPWVMGAALGCLLLVSGYVDARRDDQIRQSRSFFGVLQVSRDESYTELRHGTTLHGRQSRDPARRGEPLSYYTREGPIGRLFAELDRRSTTRRTAVIGLGTGTLAAYARPGDAITFYEIDSLVRDIAFDRRYFTYVSDAAARGVSIRVEMGDARIRMEAVRKERPGELYDLIVVDAFSSDAIPVHLLTREALRLYFDMLKVGGLLALHLSNRYLSLEPVVANLAEEAQLEGVVWSDEAPAIDGATSSTWAVLARTREALGNLARDEKWDATKLEVDPRVGVWTDDFHNLLRVFSW